MMYCRSREEKERAFNSVVGLRIGVQEEEKESLLYNTITSQSSPHRARQQTDLIHLSALCWIRWVRQHARLRKRDWNVVSEHILSLTAQDSP
jgi:hypothetical protein